MQHRATFSAGVAIAVVLVASGCSATADTGATSTSGGTSSAAASPTAAAGQLQTLVPAPAGTNHTDGPGPLTDNGIHLHFAVDGPPADVMSAYKAALQAKGWTVTTIVSSSGGPNGGGGATYTGTHGDNYGVFDGGGWGNSTYVNVCAWPAKPVEPNCSRSNQR
jgi:hypothetical protein